MVVGKKIIQTMKPYKQGMQIKEVKEKYHLSEIVKLASNENPYGFSNAVSTAIKDVANFELYPDGYAANLRQAVANKHQLNQDQLVFGAGSDEIIALICRTFLSTGDNTVMAKNTFPQYKHHAQIEGASVKEIPTVNGYHQLEDMSAAMDNNTKVVWICAPDNPTGTMISQDNFESFMEKCPSEVLVVLDIAYDEFVAQDKQLPFLKYIERYDNLIALKTFSKAYGLAAFRVGYGISSEAIANQLNIVRGPFNITTMSLAVAEKAFSDDAFLERTIESNRAVKTDFQAFLSKHNWEFFDSEANFILVKTPCNATEFATYLLENGFIVRSGDLLGYPESVRITIGTKSQMDQLKQLFLEFNKA